LKEILADPAELLSSPALHKNEFMKRLSDTDIPEDLRHKIFDEVEATFFKSLYEDAFKNDEEFRKTLVSRNGLIDSWLFAKSVLEGFKKLFAGHFSILKRTPSSSQKF
jgi:hypothetical protein